MRIAFVPTKPLKNVADRGDKRSERFEGFYKVGYSPIPVIRVSFENFLIHLANRARVPYFIPQFCFVTNEESPESEG